jgi:hypothetical protein
MNKIMQYFRGIWEEEYPVQVASKEINQKYLNGALAIRYSPESKKYITLGYLHVGPYRVIIDPNHYYMAGLFPESEAPKIENIIGFFTERAKIIEVGALIIARAIEQLRIPWVVATSEKFEDLFLYVNRKGILTTGSLDLLFRKEVVLDREPDEHSKSLKDAFEILNLKLVYV